MAAGENKGLVVAALSLLLLGACDGRAVGYEPDGGPLPSLDVAPLGPDATPIIPEIPCSEEGTWVYVIDSEHGLHRFDPPLGQFTHIATVDCPIAGQPFSMAVSRSNVAYILYYENLPWTCVGMVSVDVITGACLGLTGFDCNNPEEFRLFGMGYATLGPDTGQERLYIMRGWDDSAWLASLDPEDGTVIPLVSMGTESQAEMTGNALGELFGFFGWDNPKFVARIEVATGALHDAVPLPELSGHQATAVAFWGGDFYVFWSLAGSGDVFRVSGGSVSLHASFPFTIVGAGVSTCAPSD